MPIEWNYKAAYQGATLEEYSKIIDAQAQALPERVRRLAHLLDSINRHGDVHHQQGSASPLIYDLAEDMLTSPGAAEAVILMLSDA